MFLFLSFRIHPLIAAVSVFYPYILLVCVRVCLCAHTHTDASELLFIMRGFPTVYVFKWDLATQTIVIPSESKHPHHPLTLNIHRPRLKLHTHTHEHKHTHTVSHCKTVELRQSEKRKPPPLLNGITSKLQKLLISPMCFYFSNLHHLLWAKPE